MKLFTRPSVYLVGQQVVNEDELERFLSSEGVSWQSDSEVGAEVLAESAGRICFMSYSRPRPGGNEAYLKHIKESKHGNIYEHAVFNLIVTGVSRSLSHELIRHRVGMTPSQLSQRYVDESVAEFVVPPDLRREVEQAKLFLDSTMDGGAVEITPEDIDELFLLIEQKRLPDPGEVVSAGLIWLKSVITAQKAYVKLADHLAARWQNDWPNGPKTDGRKFARQAARSVLPNATETKLFLTVNARSARHIVEQRASRHADPEIRILAYEIWRVLKTASPNLFGDFTEAPLPDGTVELTTANGKI